MMLRIIISVLLAGLSIVSLFPEVTSYAKVSKNGQEETKSDDDLITWTSRMATQHNQTQSEGRSVKNIAITGSPVYISQKIPKLQKGEAVNYRPVGRYTTLDHEMVAKLSHKKQIQDRYHPSPFNSKNPDSPDDVKAGPKPVARPSGPPSSDNFEFSGPSFADSYDYKPPDFSNDKPMSKPPDYLSDTPISKPPDDLGDKPISKPLTMDDYANPEISDKPPDSYFSSHDHDSSDYPDYSPDSSYNSDAAPKPIQFSGHLDHPPYNDDSHHDFHHEVIYDHPPDYTEQPEMNDQRLDKRPYSYYYIGKKLWYIPLYFSIYFIIYIAALVLKSIARHKITFPSHLAEAVGHGRAGADYSWWDYAGSILESIENFAEKYGHS